jgi:hypothetical protein
MGPLIRLLVSAFELFNKIARRIREARIEQAIKRDLTHKTRDSVEESKRKVREKLRKTYGDSVDGL